MIEITLQGQPRTKKNSGQIIRAGGKRMLIPSKAYREYEADCLRQLLFETPYNIDSPVNMRCLYYMGTRRKVDLVNLLEATCDILCKALIIADDHCGVVAGHDGSRVLYDKQHPRVEITITDMEGGT